MTNTEANAISALELQPADTIREVSEGAIAYFAVGLSGLHLPEDFVERNPNVHDVKYWDARKRLRGKFGRFAVQTESGEAVEPDVLLMGTTVGLGGFDRGGFMRSLRHFEFRDQVFNAIVERGLADAERLLTRAVDYGSTEIKVGSEGQPVVVEVSGCSLDYGRADAVEREKTCQLFEQLLGDDIEVVNAEPKPRTRDQLIR